jgi:hypothetical protein
MSSIPATERGSILSAPSTKAMKLSYQSSRATFRIILCIGFTIWIVSLSAASATTRHVVLLLDEGAELPGTAMLSAEFTRTLERFPIE